LKQDGERTTGTVGDGADQGLPITSGTIRGHWISLQVELHGGSLRLELALEDDRLKGERTLIAVSNYSKTQIDAARYK
jgi:hypothetical protein